MSEKKLLSISSDRKIFEKGSAVSLRLVELYKEWQEVHIVVFSDKSYSEISLAGNIWVYPTRSISKWFYPFDAIKLGRFIIAKRNITNITCQDPFLTAMAGVSLKKQFHDANLELQVHTDIGSPNFTFSVGNKIRKSLALSYLTKADSIRVVSERIREYLIEKMQIENSKIELRPILVNVDRIKNAPVIEGANLHKKYPQFEKIVLMASRMEKEKNIELAIRSWAEVVKEFPKAGLIIVGNGSLISNLQSLISDLGLDRSVIIEPWADALTLISYFKTADLFLNTSLFEGYGMTLVEAEAAGCPIISTDVGVAREVGAEIVGWNSTEVGEKIVAHLSVTR